MALKSARVKIKVGNDREREFYLGFLAFNYLAEKHKSVTGALKKLTGNNQKELDIDSLEIMVDFVYAGLLSDAKRNKETLERDHVIDMLDDDYEGLLLAINKTMTGALPDSDPTPAQA